MKKWLVIGALTLGMVGASGQTTIQAAQQSPTESVFEKIIASSKFLVHKGIGILNKSKI